MLKKPAKPEHADLLSILPVGVMLITREHGITYANTTAENMLNVSASYLCKQGLQKIFHPYDKLLKLIDTAFSQGVPIKEYDLALTGPRTGTLLVTLHIVPISEEEVMFCFDDASTAQALSHSVIHRQNARTQSNMAAILAHEVKNPLAGIRGAAQLLHKTVKAEDRELTSLIRNETDRIKSVVEEMEFFSNPSELKTEPVNIHEILHYAKNVTEKGATKTITFREYFDPSLPQVAGHKNLLIQLFVNLLKNATEATDKNPIITLTSSYRTGFSLRMSSPQNSARLPILITIADNGCGIAPELRNSIFEPFYTSKAKGKGLGLAIVAKIIADHGGVIELDTQYEPGTCFNVLLPAV